MRQRLPHPGSTHTPTADTCLPMYPNLMTALAGTATCAARHRPHACAPITTRVYQAVVGGLGKSKKGTRVSPRASCQLASNAQYTSTEGHTAGTLSSAIAPASPSASTASTPRPSILALSTPFENVPRNSEKKNHSRMNFFTPVHEESIEV